VISATVQHSRNFMVCAGTTLYLYLYFYCQIASVSTTICN